MKQDIRKSVMKKESLYTYVISSNLMLHYSTSKAAQLLPLIRKDHIQLPLSESHRSCWEPELLSALFLSVSQTDFSPEGNLDFKSHHNFFPAAYFWFSRKYKSLFILFLLQSHTEKSAFISSRISITDSTTHLLSECNI